MRRLGSHTAADQRLGYNNGSVGFALHSSNEKLITFKLCMITLSREKFLSKDSRM